MKFEIGFDTCGGEEQQFRDWLIEQGYEAEVSSSTGQNDTVEQSLLKNSLWDKYCENANGDELK